MIRKSTILLLFLGWTLCPAAVTPACAALQSQESVYRQWQNSPHALSMDTQDEHERLNQTGCAHCHTAQGFHEVTLAGLESTAPYGDVVGLTCQACHMDGVAPDPVGPLRAGSARDACRGCR